MMYEITPAYKRIHMLRVRVNLPELEKIKISAFTNGFECISGFIRYILLSNRIINANFNN